MKSKEVLLIFDQIFKDMGGGGGGGVPKCGTSFNLICAQNIIFHMSSVL